MLTVTYIVNMLPAVDMPADFISGLVKQLLCICLHNNERHFTVLPLVILASCLYFWGGGVSGRWWGRGVPISVLVIFFRVVSLSDVTLVI